jgi:methenyltetrahydromethanopterin cyclohydrolase
LPLQGNARKSEQREGQRLALQGGMRAVGSIEGKGEPKIGFEEFSDVGVLVLESAKLPDSKVSTQIAENCGIDPADLRLAIAPTDSVAGMTQVSARVMENRITQAIHCGVRYQYG